jgi:hypothetical protein
MAATKSRAALLAAFLLLGACSDDVLPPLSDDDSDQPAQPAQTAGAPPASGSVYSSALTPTAPYAAGAPSNTFVGQKVSQLQADNERLKGQFQAHATAFQQVQSENAQTAQAYFTTTGAINARLQAGTTPGNPFLTQQWADAQSNLDRMNTEVAQLNQITTQVAGDAALSAYLLDSIRSAFGISGAVEQDHKALAALEDDVNRTAVVIDRLQSDLTDQVSRQNAYVANERRNMSTLQVAIKTGELYGSNLANRSFQANSFNTSSLGPSGIAGRRPLVVIRFDKPNVQYEQTLYSAVSQAMERRPDISFDLVAVSPAKRASGALGTSAAQRNAESVLRSLADMGLAANRVSLSSTTSQTAEANEVQLYVR